MKLFIFTMLLLPFSALKCKSQHTIIGTNHSGAIEITVSKDSLISVANKILKKQQISGILNSVSILEEVVEKSNEKYYCIKFTNSDASIKMVQLLREEKGNFYLLRPTLEGGSSVTCSGCRRGCDPKRYLDADGQVEFYCSDCTWGDTKDCKKSVSQGSLDLK